MNELKFVIKSSPIKGSVIAEKLGINIPSSLLGVEIQDVKNLTEATTHDISFLHNQKYLKDFIETKALACLVPLDFNKESKHGTILIKVKNPYYEYARLVDLFYKPAKNYSPVIKPTAYIASTAKIGKNCYIGHNVVIEEAEIGDDCVIESGTVIDYGVKIGNRARIGSNVSISYSEIGDDVVILPGAAIGQDGFGFATEAGKHKKIYHIGRVIIGNDVEIGANTTIDRGSMGDTVIGDLSRIDNLVQIGHNVHIGKGSIIVAQAGIAGSSRLGKYCAIGGQAGIAGHINLADMVQLAAQSGAIRDIKEVGEVFGGTPAVPVREWHKHSIILKKLINDRKVNG